MSSVEELERRIAALERKQEEQLSIIKDYIVSDQKASVALKAQMEAVKNSISEILKEQLSDIIKNAGNVE